MLVRVETAEQQAVFKCLWDTIRLEKGFTDDPYMNHTERSLVRGENEYIGTLEIIPYDPSIHSLVEDLFPFGKDERIREFKNQTYEIDRVSLKKGVRGKGYVEEILGEIILHSLKNKGKYYIACIDPMFLRALKGAYGIHNIHKLGEPIKNEHSKSIPILIDMEKNLIECKNQKWAQRFLRKYPQTV